MNVFAFARLRGSLAAAALLIAGCGGDDAGQGDGSRLSGTVRIDGSSTVYPITEAVAEEFMKENPGVRVNVGVSGTGGGFAKFGRGETDISNASRPIKDEEAQLAQQQNIPFIEIPVAYDGLAVVVNPQNNWVDCLTTEELNTIWMPGSTVKTWNQIRPGFPNRPINLYGPGTDSGTYDYFTSAVVGEEGASRPDFTASEDDNVLVQGIAGDPSALGYFGYAYFENNRDKLKLVGVDDGNAANGAGCIQPSPESVRTNQYQPLARPEFIYVSAARAEDPAIQAFVEYYLENAAELVEEVGYIPLSDQAYGLSLERFRARKTGSLFHGSEPGVTIEDLYSREAQGGAPDGAAADTAAAPAAAPATP